MKLNLVLFAAVAMCSFSSVAVADVATFDFADKVNFDLFQDGTAEGAFSTSAEGNALITGGASTPNLNTTSGFLFTGPGVVGDAGDLTITNIGGSSFGLFTLDSVDLRPNGAGTLSIIGTLDGTPQFSIDSTTADLGPDTNLFVTFAGNATPINGLRVSTSVSDNGNRIDNIVVSTVGVPEPTSVALLGLGGVAMLARRRR